MSDSEDDYMSAKYLEAAAELERPAKEKTYSQRRREQLQRQKEKGHIKPRAQLEQEAREQGLSTALGNDNVGMKMLMKMGFKQGSSLGKKGGLQNPIELQLKKDRSGLGTESSLKRQMEEEEEEMKKRQKMVDPGEFRQRMAARQKQQRHERYLHAAVSLCEKFDQEKGVEANILWLLKSREPEQEQQQGTSDNESEGDAASEEQKTENDLASKFAPEDIEHLQSLSLEEKLKKLVDYLRTEYLYCFWCSVKYEDENDLTNNCPGPEEDDH